MSERLLVLKFGGHAMANPARIRLAARRIAAWHRSGTAVVVVASAMAGETDRLLRLARGAQRGSSPPACRELDRLLCTGEDRASALLSLAVRARGLSSLSLRGGEAGLVAEGPHGEARVIEVRPEPIRALLSDGVVPIVSGFQAARPDGESVTLGRGTSDLTAVVLAAAINAAECHLIKDVDGIHEGDPRTTPSAGRFDTLTHNELLALTEAGARVVHPEAAFQARQRRLPIRVYSYRAPIGARGTRVGEAA